VQAPTDGVRSAAMKRNIRFEYRVPDAPLITVGDRAKLREVVYEVSRTVVDFTVDAGAVEVHLRQEDKKILLHVSATSRPDAEDSTILRDLSIARGICRLHGGTIDVRHTLKHSCEVICELPLVRP